MVQITAQQVKELRELTKVGMMECKRALTETGGDMDAAMKVLRERGLAIAAKKSERTASEGLITASVSADRQTGSMIEVNCETDFVAKNDNYKDFVQSLVARADTYADGEMAAAVADEMAAKIAEIGENLVFNRNTRYQVEGTGGVASYIHLGGKVGVLLEIACEKAETPAQDAFAQVAADICMHIAAMNPISLDRTGIPADVIDAEKAVYAKQVEGKPENIVEKILAGKLEKFFALNTLVGQAFVKDNDLSITELLVKIGKELGDTLSIRRYVRYQIGG